MKTLRKASVKAVAYCSKLSGMARSNFTSWEQCMNLLLDSKNMQYGLSTYCKRNGDYTAITLWCGDKITDTFNVPNSECLDDEGDWDMNYVSKYITEALMRQKRTSSRKAADKVIKQIKRGKSVDHKALENSINELREKIRTATGKTKRALIDEFNNKARILNALRNEE